jgi:nicotinamide riboside kinase
MVTIAQGPPRLTRIVLVGDAATTAALPQSLSRHYGCGAHVRSCLRAFGEWAGRPLTLNDLGAVARVQMAREDEYLAQAQHLVFQDHDLLATAVFIRHYAGHCAESIEAAAARRRPDAYLLCHSTAARMARPDLFEERPVEVHARLAPAIAEAGVPCLEIEGSSFTGRQTRAIAAVNRFLGL